MALPRRCVFEAHLRPGRQGGEHVESPDAEKLRLEGNGLYARGDIDGALAKYSECLAMEPANHVARSNRSACWLRLSDRGRATSRAAAAAGDVDAVTEDALAAEALEDAEICVALRPQWAKGYLRRGSAELRLGRGADARLSYARGLAACGSEEAASVGDEGGDVQKLREALALVRQRPETSVEAAVRGAMYRAMLLAPSLDLEGVFDLLQESAERLSDEMIEAKAPQLEKLMGYLAKTLECDMCVLQRSRPLREAYDRATFACGQLFASAPAAASRLKCAPRVVDALRHAMYAGWRMEPRAVSHGVAKFAANALTVLATSNEADDALRRRATRHVLHGCLAWLCDATPEPHFELALDDHHHHPPPVVISPAVPVVPAPEDTASSNVNAMYQQELAREALTLSLMDDDDAAAAAAAAVPTTTTPAVTVKKTSEEEEDEEYTSLEAAAARGEEAATSRLERLRSEQIRQQRQRVVCGCGALSARLSAATWLERLFERGAPKWVREECETMTDAETLCVELCLVVRDERAAPLGLPGLVRCLAPRLMRSTLQCDLFLRPEWRWDAALRVARQKKQDCVDDEEEERKARPGESDSAMARRLQRKMDEEAIRRARSERPLAPKPLGEWLAASLGYLVLFVDGDDLFAATACTAIRKLASVDRIDEEQPFEAADRVCRGLWAGVPLLEKLSALACKDAAAVQLLEALARRSAGARVAMLSLAAALAGGHLLQSQAAETPELLAVTSTTAPEEEVPAAVMMASAPAVLTDAARQQEAHLQLQLQEEEDSDSGAAPTPSWAEYFHEMQGTLGVGKSTSEEHEEESMVLLSNFEAAALELPVTGELEARLEGEAEPCIRVDAVPAAWNERCATSEESSNGFFGGLSGDASLVLGSPEWAASVKPGGCVVVERSAIRRSPRAPDWATAVQLCADAGAAAAIVVNDLEDDGKARPAFRMGVFGAARPSIAGFMVCGADGEKLRELQRKCSLVEEQEEEEEFEDPAMIEAEGEALSSSPRSTSSSSSSSSVEVDCDYTCAKLLCQSSAEKAPVGDNKVTASSRKRDRTQIHRPRQRKEPVAVQEVKQTTKKKITKQDQRVLEVRVKTIRNSDLREERRRKKEEQGGDRRRKDSSSAMDEAPTWPLRGVPRDIAQAWALAEVAQSAMPEVDLALELSTLAAKMDSAEKRVWLARRLQRHHCGVRRAAAAHPDEEEVIISSLEEDEDEPALAFVECDRHAPMLPQLRTSMVEKVGLGAPDITGDLEVRFTGESAVGSAVLREWMDLAAVRGAVTGGGRLLRSTDGGRSFALNAASRFLNPCWRLDFEILGRLVGLALWHQVTLDLPLHAHVAQAILNDGIEEEQSLEGDMVRLTQLDPALAASVTWILENDVDGLDLPFTDALDTEDHQIPDAPKEDEEEEEGTPSSKRRKESDLSEETHVMNVVEDVVLTSSSALPGTDNDEAAATSQKQIGAGARISLCDGGEELVVTNENKREFAAALCDWRLRSGLREILGAVLTGVYATVPSAVLVDARKMLSATDLAHLLSGLRDVDVEDWRLNTRYAGGLRPEAPEVKFFWETVRAWNAKGGVSKSRLNGLLQFATGSRRVPVGGFAHLVGLNGGKHPFTLSSGAHLTKGSLPTAHACICTIDLPRFETLEAAGKKLQEAVEVGTLRFDEHAGPDND